MRFYRWKMNMKISIIRIRRRRIKRYRRGIRIGEIKERLLKRLYKEMMKNNMEI